MLIGNCLSAENPMVGTPAETKWRAGFSVIPPVPVTTAGHVEWRLAVSNCSAVDASIHVKVVIRSADGVKKEIFSECPKVEAHGEELLTGPIVVTDCSGDFDVEYEASTPGEQKLAGKQRISVIASDLPAVPLCQVAWLEPAAIASDGYEHKRPIEESDLRAMISSLNDIGIRCLIVAYPEMVYASRGAFYPSEQYADRPRDPTFDVIGTILGAAEDNGQKVILGLGRGPDLYLTWDAWESPQRLATGIQVSKATADELWKLYGKSPAFYGWYLSHEANDIARASKHYYNPVIKHLRKLAAEKPVLISPSGTPEISAEILEQCDADIISYQDAVGPGYIPYTYTWNPERRLKMLPEVYAEYAKVHRQARQQLWSTVEFWEMAGPNYGRAYPANFERVQRQILTECSYVNVLTAYAALGFLEHPDSTVALGGRRAQRLYTDYRTYYYQTARELGISTLLQEKPTCTKLP